MNRSNTVGMPSFRTPDGHQEVSRFYLNIGVRQHPSVRLGDFHPPYWLRFVGPVQQLFPDGWPVLLEGIDSEVGPALRLGAWTGNGLVDVVVRDQAGSAAADVGNIQ